MLKTSRFYNLVLQIGPFHPYNISVQPSFKCYQWLIYQKCTDVPIWVPILSCFPLISQILREPVWAQPTQLLENPVSVIWGLLFSFPSTLQALLETFMIQG